MNRTNREFFGFLEDESFHEFLKNIAEFERVAKLWKESKERVGEVFSWKEFIDTARAHAKSNIENN